MIKENKLRAKIVEQGITIKLISEKIGINVSTFYRKVHNNSFTINEMARIIEILNLTTDEAIDIFFASERA